MIDIGARYQFIFRGVPRLLLEEVCRFASEKFTRKEALSLVGAQTLQPQRQTRFAATARELVR
jgi:hypothetical protein